jgi:hypothetical protein
MVRLDYERHVRHLGPKHIRHADIVPGGMSEVVDVAYLAKLTLGVLQTPYRRLVVHQPAPSPHCR